MGRVWSVTLPHELAPHFTGECVVCDEHTDATAKICASPQHLLLLILFPILYLFGWSRVEFPLCRGCRFTFYFQRWGRTLICWTVLFIIAMVVSRYLADWSSLVQRIALVGIAIVVLVPYFLFEAYVPRSFDVTSRYRSVDYEFGTQERAFGFMIYNEGHYPQTKMRVE